jgi:hypothetical protein
VPEPSADQHDALFHLEGDAYVPTDLTRGPWTPDAQHGGPPAALLARAVEAVDAPAPMQVARMTFELLRPVPLVPLTVTTTVLRPGKKVQLVGASLHAGETEVVRCVALRIRSASLPLSPGVPVDEGRPDLPDGAASGEPPFAVPDADLRYFHRDAMEVRAVAGGFDRPGPATAWFRLRVPVVEGEEPSGAVRAAATADFGNGLSWVLPPEWLFINPDLTVHLLRPPAGEWLCLAARTLPSDTGVGVAESAIYDEHGRVGRSVQSLLLDDTR